MTESTAPQTRATRAATAGPRFDLEGTPEPKKPPRAASLYIRGVAIAVVAAVVGLVGAVEPSMQYLFVASALLGLVSLGVLIEASHRALRGIDYLVQGSGADGRR